MLGLTEGLTDSWTDSQKSALPHLLPGGRSVLSFNLQPCWASSVDPAFQGMGLKVFQRVASPGAWAAERGRCMRDRGVRRKPQPVLGVSGAEGQG